MRAKIAAALAGKFVPALLNLACLPIIASILGMESFGLIAFYNVLQTLFQVLDFGATQGYTWEISRRRTSQDVPGDLHSLTSTLEILLVAVAALVIVFFFIFGDGVVAEWVNTTSDHSGTAGAIPFMGIALGLNYFIVIYQGGLYGLEKIGTSAAITCGGAVLRTVGAVAVLRIFSASIATYFVCVAFSNLVLTVLLRRSLHRGLGESRTTRRRFDATQLRSIWKFSAAVAVLNICSVVTTQYDRIFLSKYVSLATLGYYALALQLAAVPTLLVIPVKDVLFPRLARLISTRDEQELSRLYHRATQVVLCFTLPIAGVLIAFPAEIVLFWTHDAQTTAVIAPVVRLLVIGFAFASITFVPYVLQLAAGWVSLQLKLVVALLAAMVVALPFLADRWGINGVAACWAVLNALLFVANVEFMHRRLLTREKAAWYLKSLVPSVGIGAIPIALAVAVPIRFRVVPPIVFVGLAGTCTFAVISVALGLAQDLLRSLSVLRGRQLITSPVTQSAAPQDHNPTEANRSIDPV